MLTILSTGVGGGSGMYTLQILKESSEFRLIACDASPYLLDCPFGDKFFQIPYVKEKDKFLRCLKDIVVEEKVDYIFPNVDEELTVFAEHNKIGNAKVIISPLESVINTIDKYQLYLAFRDHFHCPETFLLEDFSFKEGEWVVKPRFGRGSKDIFHADTKQMFDSLIGYLTCIGYNNHNLIIQEKLPGKEYTVDVLCGMSGNEIAIIPRERIQTSGGISAIGKTKKDNYLISITREIIKIMRFLGPINVQFKENIKGKPKLSGN